MGRSVPAEPVWEGDGARAERAVWRWAVAQLPDDVLVLPSVMITRRRDGAPEEAEVDLVLVDPDHGVTVVEVKGGTVSHRDGRWHGVHRDPVQQAKRARSIVKRAIGQTDVDPETVALRWTVATPDCRLQAPGEPILPEEQLWDALAAVDLAIRYRQVCGELTLGERPLGPDRADFLARYLSGRTREGRAVLTTALEEHEEQVRVHSASHARALRHIWQHPRVLVRGAAGTGKTMLAVEAAVTYASMGQRVLLTCWNIVLARWLQSRVRDELAATGMDPEVVTDDPTGQVVVGHLVGLARRARQDAGQAVDPPAPDAGSEAVHDYFHEVLPEALTLGRTQGPFDVVVLDEAQDLSDLWVFALDGLVVRQGRWYAFSDRQQDLFASSAELPVFLEHPHALAENFRNSRQVAGFAGQFGDISTDCVTGDGPPVRYVACPVDRVEARSQETAKKLVRDDRLAPSDVAVLHLFANPYRGRADEVAALVESQELVTTNSASFKGMERPAVVLGLDLDRNKTDRVEEVSRAIYAAATRARSHLTVVGDPDVCKAYGFDAMAAALREAG